MSESRFSPSERFVDVPGGRIFTLQWGDGPLLVFTHATGMCARTYLDLLEPLGEWTAPAANEPEHTVHGHMFMHPWVGGIAVRGEIEELLWFDPSSTRDDLAPLFEHRVLPALRERA